MGKAKLVYPDGLERWSLRKASRTAAAWRETNKAQRAHQMVMGTLRSVHLPRQSRFRNPRGMTEVLSPACRTLALPILLNVNGP